MRVGRDLSFFAFMVMVSPRAIDCRVEYEISRSSECKSVLLPPDEPCCSTLLAHRTAPASRLSPPPIALAFLKFYRTRLTTIQTCTPLSPNTMRMQTWLLILAPLLIYSFLQLKFYQYGACALILTQLLQHSSLEIDLYGNGLYTLDPIRVLQIFISSTQIISRSLNLVIPLLHRPIWTVRFILRGH